MIYDQPRFLPGGDCYVTVEFGNEMNLELNFLAQGVAHVLAGGEIPGIIESAPCFASLLVHYDPDEISFDSLVTELQRLLEALGSPEEVELDSRLFYFETLYLDPWTRQCVEDYRAKIAGPAGIEKEDDPAFVARINGLSGEDQLVRVHSGTEYWVASLGFWPGLPFMMALDPRCVLTTPKYNPPRTATPQGAVGMGGSSSCIYPVATPGGYQIFGRTPIPIWDLERRFDVFQDSIVLFRPGDRVRFVPVDRQEFDHAERLVQQGRYVYKVVEYQRFSVRNYKRWVASLDLSDRF